MFKPLRKKKFVQVTMWALLVTFLAWGVGSVATSQKNYAGIIFGKKVSIPKFNQSYLAILNRAKMMYGDNLPKMEKFLDLRGQAWDRLILEHEAKRRLIRASNKEVIERIAVFQLFHTSGVFDKRRYGQIVENIFQTTPREFEESVRGDIIIEKLVNSITKDVKLTEDEIKQGYRAENELADLSFLLIKDEDYRDKVEVRDEELSAFYKENRDSFRSPVSVNVDYLRIPFGDEKEEARFAAEELMAFIKKGRPLEEVSDEYGLELKETGFFSVNSKIPEIGLSYPFILAALALKENQISDMVETSDSFCIIRLKSKRPPSLLPFEEAKDKTKDMLIMKKAQGLAEAGARRALSQINDEGKGLEEITQQLGYKLLTAKGITRNSYIEEVGLSDSFANVAFSLKSNQVGGPAKTQKGHAIIRLDHLRPINEDEFQKQKDSFSKTFLDKKRGECFQKWFLEFKKKACLKENL